MRLSALGLVIVLLTAAAVAQQPTGDAADAIFVNGKIGPEQKISREQALRVATINYAYMTFEEKLKGSIEPGKLADFLILSGDVLTVPEDQILSLHPLATYVGGRKVFARPGGGF